ncbi:Uncharacterised protein [uncultured archaeon]|nr:Uncharacterised protein [uncultured archaeon]
MSWYCIGCSVFVELAYSRTKQYCTRKPYETSYGVNSARSREIPCANTERQCGEPASAPYPVPVDAVYDSGNYCAIYEVCLKFQSFCKHTRHDSGCSGCEYHLEHPEHYCLNVIGIAGQEEATPSNPGIARFQSRDKL